MAEPQSLNQLYEEIDREVSRLSRLHQDRLQCAKGCTDCCIDDLSIFEVEVENIRHSVRNSLQGSKPHPPGACAFLDSQGTCRIYAARPYVCRTQGLPLRWLEERESELVELRDICPLNEEGPPIEILAETECWTIGPFEGRLAELQKQNFGHLRRISLRTLFAELSGEEPPQTSPDGA